MNVFTVTNSTLSSEHLALYLKDAYKLNGAATARILKTGISHTYLVTDEKQKYIFRVYSLGWRTEEEITEEIKLLNLLRENNLPVSCPIADAASSYIQQLNAPEGLRFGVMFSFAKGEKMLNFPAALHYKLGQTMAGIHNLTHNLALKRVTYSNETLLINSFKQLKQFLPADTQEMIYMQSLQQYLINLFAKQDIDKLRKGIVHLDIWFDNISIDKDDITIFDFDFCGNGWLLLDIAYYILQVYSTEKDEKEFNLKKESFLQGYESVSIINKEERDLLPAAAVSLYFFYLGVQCSRYDNWSNTFLNEIYLKRFINLLVKKLAESNQIIVAQ